MAGVDTTVLNAVLKTQYTQSKVNSLVYPESPLFAKLKKRTDFGGPNKVVAFHYGNPQGRAIDFATGLANVGQSSYAKVTVTRSRDYAFGRITNEAALASAKDAYSLLDGYKREVDNAFYTAGRSLTAQLFRNGGGARGKISAGSNVGTTSITLANINDVVNFEVGMILNSSTTDGTSAAKKAGTVTLTAVNRDTGVLTASGNWSAGIGTVAASDFLFQNGDFESTNSAIMGLAGWIPATAPSPSESFFGLDRSVDPTRLAGLRYTDNTGGAIEETLIKCSARLAREGASPDLVVLNPIDLGNMVVALGSRVVYDRMTSSDEADIGFKTVRLIGARGPIDVISDLNCPQGAGWMLTSRVWSFESLGAAPQLLDLDGLKIRASATADAWDFRIGFYGNLICEAPGWNAYFTL